MKLTCPLTCPAGVTCRLFELNDLEEMACLLANSFSLGEPMACAVGLSREEIHAIVTLFGPKAATESVSRCSTVLRGQNDWRLFWLRTSPRPRRKVWIELPRHSTQLARILDGLDESYRRDKEIRPGEFLHLFMLGVEPSAEGKKIGQTLVAECLKHGHQKRYRTAVTEATGSASQHVFRRLGFADRLAANYHRL